MAGEKKFEKPVPVAAGLKANSSTKVAEQDVASSKGGVKSELAASISSSGDTTTSIQGETAQESVAEQGVYYQPTTCHNYCYPGFNGSFTQSDSPGSQNSGDGSLTAIQSDNGSLLYYMPGYNPYTAGTFMGIEGQQPYFSSSEYINLPVSYGSEAMSCYPWDTTYAGDFSNRTNAGSGNARNFGGSKGSVKSNYFNVAYANGSLAGKTAVPLDSKLRRSTASSNYAKSTLSNQTFNPSNQLGSGFQLGDPGKGYYPVGKFPSYSNPNQGFYPHSGTMNYRPNGGTWNGNNRNKSQERWNRSGEFEDSAELTRGPRANNKSNPSNLPAEDEQPGFDLQRDQYNLESFQIDYDNAKFFVIKSYSEDDIHKCIKYDVWSSTPNGNKKLDNAFHDAELKQSETGKKCPIFLFFSVNGSGQFVGVAEMIGQVDFNKNMDFWQLDKWNGFFPVKWHIIKDISNIQLRHIILENNDNRPVTFSRDTQEIGLKQGLEMLKIFKSCSGKTSMLDDFNFYENREKSLRAKRTNRQASQEERSRNNDLSPNHARATDTSSDPKSLVSLTKKLSINSNPANGGGSG